MRWSILLFATALAGCVSSTVPSAPEEPVVLRASQSDYARFKAVATRVVPVASQVCRQNTRNMICDFEVAVDSRPDVPANAWQFTSPNGQPTILFSQAMLADMQNDDEIAFVIGHEAAHHIANHVSRDIRNAIHGSLWLSGAALLHGADAEEIDAAIDVGGAAGVYAYAQDFEIEADRIGAIIAHAAGYDPARGVLVFSRGSDVSSEFLQTHPPSRKRIEAVRRVAAGL